ncbi:MAG: hypothetical protein GC171_11740 [Terrimonas sp.]|nr:hypothetical protein [Terrimonas sp.]
MKKVFTLFIFFSLINKFSSAQSKMIMLLDGKESDLLGYSMEPSTGATKEIRLFGPLQNAILAFQSGLASAKTIPAISITTSDINTGTTTIKLLNVTVLDLKQYNSTYKNGIFEITSGGNMNTEVRCKYGNIEMANGASKTMSSSENIKGLATYEMKKNPSMKGATGRLILQLPADAEFSMNKVLASGDKKYIGHFFRGDNIGLFPGNYDVYIYGAIVSNVEIQKGMETRIKAGVLNLTDALLYRVYGPNGKTWVEMFKGPKKIGLPVGTYSISVNNGQTQDIAIKDGEETEF